MEMHEEIGAYAKKKGLDGMYSVGLLSAFAANKFGGTHHDCKQDLINALSDLCEKTADTTILIKGSRSSGMDEVVNTLSRKENS